MVKKTSSAKNRIQMNENRCEHRTAAGEEKLEWLSGANE